MERIANILHTSDWMRITEYEEKVDLSNVHDIDNVDFNILNKNKTVEIDIDGVIGGSFWEDDDPKNINTKEKMKKELRLLSEMKAGNVIVNINSIGGSFAHAISIHDLLANHDGHVTTRVSGMTASAASIIAQAGHSREMSINALQLAHRASIGIMANINLNKVKEIEETLNVIDKKITDIYQNRTGQQRKTIEELLDSQQGNGRWLDSEEALKLGFIDKVYEPKNGSKPSNKVIIKQLQNYHLPIPLNMAQEAENRSLIDQLKDFVSDLIGSKKSEEQVVNQETNTEEKPVIVEEQPVVENKADEVVAQLNLDLENARKEIESRDNRIKELETEILKAQGSSTIVKSAQGIEDIEDGKMTDEEKQVYDDLLKLRNEMSQVKVGF